MWYFAPEVKEGFCTPQGVTKNGNDYTYTLTDICTDVWLSDIEPTTQLNQVKVGDYYYSDGTWSTTLASDKTCIGIVFKVGEGTGDKKSNYGGTIAATKIHRYVVALKDAHKDPGAWGIRLVNEKAAGRNSQSTTDYDGYSNTTYIRNIGDDYNNTDVSQPLKDSQYWAFKVASVYQPVSSATPAAPVNSSGWYLPSYKQFDDLRAIENIDASRLNAVSYIKMTSHNTEEENHYWTSTEATIHNSYQYVFKSTYDNRLGLWDKAKSNNLASTEPPTTEFLSKCKSYVRAILTF